VSVIHISNMVVRPRSQNPWQLASPRSSVAAGGCGASAVGVDESGALVPAAFRTRQLMLENILGSRSTRQGESAVPHKCLHSSATHRAGYAPVRPFCTTEHAQRSSWLRSHHRQRAYPTENGCTVDGRYPSTCSPTGCYHSTSLGIPKAMCQRHSFAYPVLPRLVCPGLGGQERSAHSGSDPFEPPRQLWWRTYNEPPGQTE